MLYDIVESGVGEYHEQSSFPLDARGSTKKKLMK